MFSSLSVILCIRQLLRKVLTKDIMHSNTLGCQERKKSYTVTVSLASEHHFHALGSWREWFAKFVCQKCERGQTQVSLAQRTDHWHVFAGQKLLIKGGCWPPSSVLNQQGCQRGDAGSQRITSSRRPPGFSPAALPQVPARCDAAAKGVAERRRRGGRLGKQLVTFHSFCCTSSS